MLSAGAIASMLCQHVEQMGWTRPTMATTSHPIPGKRTVCAAIAACAINVLIAGSRRVALRAQLVLQLA